MNLPKYYLFLWNRSQFDPVHTVIEHPCIFLLHKLRSHKMHIKELRLTCFINFSPLLRELLFNLDIILVKHIIKCFSPVSVCFPPFMSQYSTQHSCLKCVQTKLHVGETPIAM